MRRTSKLTRRAAAGALMILISGGSMAAGWVAVPNAVGIIINCPPAPTKGSYC